MDDTHTTLDPARYPELIEAGAAVWRRWGYSLGAVGNAGTMDTYTEGSLAIPLSLSGLGVGTWTYGAASLRLPGAVALETFDLPRACVLVFGQEGGGLSDAARSACAATVSIAQFGSTRSINVGAAAAIAFLTAAVHHGFEGQA